MIFRSIANNMYYWILIFLGTGCHFNNQKNTPPEKRFLLGNTTVGVQRIATNLDVPWQLVWGSDQQIWFTEQGGGISKVDPLTGKVKRLLTLDSVYRSTTGGLLGMAVHPDLEQHPYVFINYSAYIAKDSTVAKIVRYTYDKDTLTNPLTMLTYPAWKGHFGARIVMAPDGKVMISTGDGAQLPNAQNIQSPNGKILRYNIDGTIPDDNPFPGNPVWAWGLRNPQGLVYGPNGKLYNSDHGDATDDEVNLIGRAGNYGWPNVWAYSDTGKEKAFTIDSSFVDPLKSWTPTIAPAGMAYYGSDRIPELTGKLLLTTLKGNSLRSLELNSTGDSIVGDVDYFQQVFGRLRSVCVSPEGDIYIATSNRDWNPNAFADTEDDRILRIYRLDGRLEGKDTIPSAQIIRKTADVVSKGEELYLNYCASCHKPNGKGLEGTFPSLVKSPTIIGDKDSLLDLVLQGKKEMPSFSFLEDKEVAIVLTYVRKKFGPQAGSISAQEVTERKIIK